MDYELRAAKARQEAMRAKSGWHEPQPKIKIKPLPKPKINYAALALFISGCVGNAVPDGDPIDQIIPYLRSYGIDQWDCVKHLNKACKILGYKSYNAYLIGMWDTFNEICEPDQRRENPWK